MKDSKIRLLAFIRPRRECEAISDFFIGQLKEKIGASHSAVSALSGFTAPNWSANPSAVFGTISIRRSLVYPSTANSSRANPQTSFLILANASWISTWVRLKSCLPFSAPPAKLLVRNPSDR